MFANRISFTFNFLGPSYTVDTACSSSYYALHQAVTSIRANECNAAIIGGMHLLLHPSSTIQLQKLGVLSPDGKCKTFDITADGYVRSEAVVAILLQKMTDARRIYASVIGTKVNADGYKTEGITYPSGERQYQMLRELYSEMGINPADVIYVEAHGTGTKVGDPIEVNSIDRVFCKNRKTPLLIGSVKSNMGHAEPASGLCSIAKMLIAMESGVIPANLHFTIPNPNIPALIEGRIQVVNKPTSWNGGIVGINSLGYGGTNSHIILRSNPKLKLSPVLSIIESLPKLIVVSGHTEEAIHVLLNKANEHRKDDEFLSLLYAVYNNDIPKHRFRGYEILNNEGTREVIKIINYDNKRPIWFIFSGMGTQWSGMGRELFRIEICQRSLQRCADVLMPHDIDLMNIIINGTDETYENVTNSFVTIVAIQIALVDMLKWIGIHPDGIIGHSVGELSCAYADNIFTLEQTVLAAYYRGKALVDSKLEPGGMATIGLSWEETKKICPSDIDLACHNSADLVTISGPIKSVQEFIKEVKSKNIFIRPINSSGIAFHSKYLVSAGPKLRDSLDQIIPHSKQRSARWLSTSIPEAEWISPLAQFSSSEYHTNNLLSPVLFQQAIKHISKNAITIEIAPHCLLQTILRRSLPLTVTNISLCKRDHPNNLVFLLSNLGKLYIANKQPNISKLYPPVSFPVGRGTPMIGSLVKWDHSITWNVPKLKQILGQSEECIVEVDVSKEEDAFLAGHKIDGRFIFPGAGYILMAWKTFAKLRGVNFEQLPVVFENVWFQRITILKEKPLTFSINIFMRTGYFEICEVDTVIASGNIRASETAVKDHLKLSSPPISLTDEEFLLLKTKDVYTEFRLRGYEHDGTFQGIISCDNYVTIGELRWSNEWISYLDNMFQFNMLANSRKLVYGSRIQYVAIDPIFHRQLIEKLPEGSGLKIYRYKNISTIKSGGIEIRGIINYTAPQRQQNQTNPKYERYVFVPYENSYTLMKDPTRGKVHALTVLLQIILENVKTFKIKIVEVAGQRIAEALLAPLVLDILRGEPLFTVSA